ncbi:MAG: hypothetical protein EOM68_20070 [Spirochaetia bacterium]|nr:hypothetical protein [Spirochaetia bacterium]
MAYPPWLMQYKTAGIYFQKKDEDTYRVIRAHSERVPGMKYPRLVIDEYIGTATKDGGLVPYMPKVKGAVAVKRYGLYWLVGKVAQPAFLGPGFCQGYLLFAYGDCGRQFWKMDWISEEIEYREVDAFESQRIATGLGHSLGKRYGDDYRSLILLASFYCRVLVNGQWRDVYPEGWREKLHGLV